MKATGAAFHASFSAFGPTFARVYNDPSQVEGGTQLENRAGLYRTLWQLYANEIFEDPKAWSSYRSQYKLYRQIRSLYNPCRRLVDFYAGAVYPGVLSTDASRLPNGTPIAIPFPEDTPPELTTAIAQFWRWTNWQATKGVFVRYGAITGNVLVEVLDEVEAGKVTANVVWPALVSWLDLDNAGNVKGYALEYFASDDDGLRYIYRKEVDGETFRTYRDGQLFDYTGAGAEYENPYGFCPAVWAKHKDVGSNYGAPAIHGSQGKLDEINGLASHIHDQIHKVIGAPAVLWTDQGIQNILGPGKQTKRPGVTDDFSDVVDSDRESYLLLKGGLGGRVDSLAGSLPLAEAMAILDALIAEVAEDHPELRLYKELRGMSQLTGPAAARVMGDVGGLVAESAANYDRASIALFQMACAIGGWRANAGDWGTLSRHQQAFLPFDLASYAQGDMDLAILARPLLQPTERETLELAILREGVGVVPTVTDAVRGIV